MRIDSLDISAGFAGLDAVSMQGLSDIVLLAGPNGGGKSRLLDAVSHYARAKLTDEQAREKQATIAISRKSIGNYNSAIETQRLQGGDGSEIRVKQLTSAKDTQSEQIAALNFELDTSRQIVVSPLGNKPVVVDYRVKNLNLKDSRAFAIRDMLKCREHMASSFNVDLATEYGLAAIHELLYLHVHSKFSADKNDLHVQLDSDVRRLKDLVRDMLRTELEYDGESGPKLFGKPISEAGLSRGQTVLLQIVSSLFFQDGTKEDLILLLDEPEMHLHPGAIIYLVDRIRSSCPHAQVWIATHSLHLLAHFPEHHTWFVKDGTVKKAGRNREDVLQSLVGDERGIDELADFLALPAMSAALGFAAQCMVAPAAVDTLVGDPQTTQIRDIIHSLVTPGDVLRVLDFGMGKGRLLLEMEESHTALEHAVDYRGFDLGASIEDQEICLGRIRRAYSDSSPRYWTKIADLRGGINRHTLHVVVMCNVLHEVPPEDWMELFGADGYLTDLLHPNGYLLVVEDQLLKVGERAHDYGFLVLGAPELRILFGCGQEDRSFMTRKHPNPKYSDRLHAHLIPAGFVERVTAQLAGAAIRELRDNALREVKALQAAEANRKSAREYAFWAHQFVNASLAGKTFS